MAGEKIEEWYEALKTDGWDKYGLTLKNRTEFFLELSGVKCGCTVRKGTNDATDRRFYWRFYVDEGEETEEQRQMVVEIMQKAKVRTTQEPTERAIAWDYTKCGDAICRRFYEAAGIRNSFYPQVDHAEP